MDNISTASFNNPKSNKQTMNEHVNVQYMNSTNNKDWNDPFNDRKIENLIYKENTTGANGGESKIYRNNNP